MQDSYQIRVSDDAIEDVIARYQAIVAAREQDPERLTEIYRDVDDVVATNTNTPATLSSANAVVLDYCTAVKSWSRLSG